MFEAHQTLPKTCDLGPLWHQHLTKNSSPNGIKQTLPKNYPQISKQTQTQGRKGSHRYPREGLPPPSQAPARRLPRALEPKLESYGAQATFWAPTMNGTGALRSAPETVSEQSLAKNGRISNPPTICYVVSTSDTPETYDFGPLWHQNLTNKFSQNSIRQTIHPGSWILDPGS